MILRRAIFQERTEVFMPQNVITKRRRKKQHTAYKQKTNHFLLTIISLIGLILCLSVYIHIEKGEYYINKAATYILQNNTEQSAQMMTRLNQIQIDLYKTKDRRTLFEVACKAGNVELAKQLCNQRVLKHSYSNYVYEIALNTAIFDANLLYKIIYNRAKDDNGVLSNEKAMDLFSQYTVDIVNLFSVKKDPAWRKSAEEFLVNNTKNVNQETVQTLFLSAAKEDLVKLFATIYQNNNGPQLMQIKNDQGMTAWELAVKHGSLKIQKKIRALDPNEKDKEKNPDISGMIANPPTNDAQHPLVEDFDALTAEIDAMSKEFDLGNNFGF